MVMLEFREKGESRGRNLILADSNSDVCALLDDKTPLIFFPESDDPLIPSFDFDESPTGPCALFVVAEGGDVVALEVTCEGMTT